MEVKALDVVAWRVVGSDCCLGREDLKIILGPGVVLWGYHKRGRCLSSSVPGEADDSWLPWTPEAARRVGRWSVVVLRAASWDHSATQSGNAGSGAGSARQSQGVLHQVQNGSGDRRRRCRWAESVVWPRRRWMTAPTSARGCKHTHNSRRIGSQNAHIYKLLNLLFTMMYTIFHLYRNILIYYHIFNITFNRI